MIRSSNIVAMLVSLFAAGDVQVELDDPPKRFDPAPPRFDATSTAAYDGPRLTADVYPRPAHHDNVALQARARRRANKRKRRWQG